MSVADMTRIECLDAQRRWNELLRRLDGGETFLLCRSGEPVAVLAPALPGVDHPGAAGFTEARELNELIERLEVQNRKTGKALDVAFAELAETRKALERWRQERAIRFSDGN